MSTQKRQPTSVATFTLASSFKRPGHALARSNASSKPPTAESTLGL